MSVGSGKQSGSSSGSTTSNTTGSSTSTSSSGFGNILGWASNFLNKEISPLMGNYINSLNNALTHGNLTGSMIPMAQAAIAQARGAASANLGSAENFLARSGGANSPFAAQLLNATAAQGNEATAQAPVDIYKSLLGAIPGFLQGMQGIASQGLGAAGALNRTQTTNFNEMTRGTSQNKGSSSSFDFGGGIHWDPTKGFSF